MAVDITPYIGVILTAALAFGGSYAAFSARLAKLETMIVDLRRDVEKHNNIIERTFKLESDVHTAFKRIDDLKEADHRIEERLGR